MHHVRTVQAPPHCRSPRLAVSTAPRFLRALHQRGRALRSEDARQDTPAPFESAISNCEVVAYCPGPGVCVPQGAGRGCEPA